MATIKYQATDASGKVHKRVSAAGRVYTHCVVFHHPAREGYTRTDSKGNVYKFGPWAAHDDTSWAGSLRLAHQRARGACNGVTAEIVEAKVI